MNEIISINQTNINVVSHEDTFIISNKEVAKAFGVVPTSIRNMKNNNKDELLEDIHWVTQLVSGVEKTMWTKKGIITLGFKLRTTTQTIAFRDWASDYILGGANKPLTQLQLAQIQINKMVDMEMTLATVVEDIALIKNKTAHDIKPSTEFISKTSILAPKKVIDYVLANNKFKTSNGTKVLDNGNVVDYISYEKIKVLKKINKILTKSEKHIKVNGQWQTHYYTHKDIQGKFRWEM